MAPTSQIIADWLVRQVAAELGIEPQELDTREPLARYGLSSRQAVSLSGELEEWLERRLSPTLAYDYPTIEALALYLAGGGEATPAASAASTPATAGREAIAIIGMGCRFPGAEGPEAFWQLLCDGVDAVREVPPERWDGRAFYDPDPASPGKMNTRWGGFLTDLAGFDRHFFGITPREAERIDPQHRLLLEVAWEALEDAGQAAQRLVGTPTGVFIGISSNDYGHFLLDEPGLSNPYGGTGNALSIAANRLSYTFGLRGPSVAVDTACSSSLVAVHLACASLWSGESSLALAGGVNAILLPAITVNFAKAGFMAPDGRCKAFDASADGYVRGEGAGVVVLKPLRRALADGDPIHALIRGSAVNHDGRSNGLTAPSRLAQQAVLEEAYRQAGLPPGRVSYVEAHGTGTALGDPIEAAALGAVLDRERPAGRPCFVGSVKTNIGHLEAAAGIAGLIKVALALRQRAIPASLHFQQPNPRIPFAELPLRVPQTLLPWPEESGPAVAGVSAFGFGGTNAHVVVEEAPPPGAEALPPAAPAGERVELLPLSARSAPALAALARSFKAWLDSGEDGPRALAEATWTAGARRTHHAHRLAVVGASRREMVQQLSAHLQGEPRRGLSAGEVHEDAGRGVVFVMSGQGCQWPGMGCDLARDEPVFRQALLQFEEPVRKQAGWSLSAELSAPAGRSRLVETAVAQPAILAVEVALAALWRSWGVEPAAVVGHSVGELAAAVVAGALRPEEAMAIAVRRGRLMQRLAGQGDMVAVGLAEDEAAELLAGLGGGVVVAAVNSPAAVVLSGAEPALATAVAALKRRGVFCRYLKVGFAFHGPEMAQVGAELEAELTDLSPRPAAIPLVSSMTGAVIPGEALGARYWGQSLGQIVRFGAAVESLRRDGYGAYLEVGPRPMLARPLTECLLGGRGPGRVLSSLRPGQDGRRSLLESLGALYTLGQEVEWGALHPASRRAVRLPSYPWQRERHWAAVAAHRGQPAGAVPPPGAVAPSARIFPGRRLRSPLFDQVAFEVEVGCGALPYLADHRLWGRPVVPAALYLALALAGAAEALGTAAVRLEDVAFPEPLFLRQGEGKSVQLVLATRADGGMGFEIHGLVAETATGAAGWRKHACGVARRIAPALAASGAEPPAQSTAGAEPLPAEGFYLELAARGLEYGPGFRRIEALWQSAGAALGRLRPPGAPEGPEDGPLHPALLDACFQVMAAALPAATRLEADGGLYLPVSIESFWYAERPGRCLWSYAVLRPPVRAAAYTADFRLLDEAGLEVGGVRGLTVQRAHREPLFDGAPGPAGHQLYQVEWRPEGEVLSAGEPPDPKDGEAGSWLILADRKGVAAGLAARLEALGEPCATWLPSDAAERSADGGPAAEALERTLAELAAVGRPPLRGVVHLWSLETTPTAAVDARSLATDQTLACGSVLHLVQILGKLRLPRPPRLWLVTQGAQAAGSEPGPLAVAQAPVLGLGRVIALEHPELRCSLVDLDPDAAEDGAGALYAEVRRADRAEDQVALRRGRRWVPRLAARAPGPRPSGDRLAAPGGQPSRLVADASGVLDRMTLQPMVRRPPGPGEVEIRVEAAGLNFRDLLQALAAYPGAPGPLGGECAGQVVALGSAVEGLQIGDPVLAVAPASFSSFVTTGAALVARRPPGLASEDAAGIPIAFLTAGYALHRVARLAAGERVLIHAAAGGLGLAAVQLARRAGATVFATAGSDEKRQLLRSWGVEQVMNSRSLAFAGEVREATAGRGVDLVLNSLAGEFIPASLSVLAPGGRFLEVGKRGIWSAEQVARQRGDVSYRVIDLAALCETDPELVRSMLAELLAGFADGSLKPLPRRVYPVAEAVSAFRTMAQARHVGKLVLTLAGAEALPPAADAVPRIRAEATYLVTGGLGALGLLSARWLTGQGARCLVLAGRRPPSPEVETILHGLRQQGARVVVMRADVAREDEVAGLLAEIENSLPPLAGIVHAAGLLADGMLLDQRWERFAEVLAPKVEGAWNLHLQTRHRSLDFFVLFSSLAGVLGSPGQAGYAAANAFLDALAHHRRAAGLPAVSIDWGPWAGVGMAAAVGGEGQRRPWGAGLGAIDRHEGLEMLGRLLTGPAPQIVAAAVDWPTFLRQFPAGRTPSLLAEIASRGALAGDGATASARVSRLRALPAAEGRALLADHLRAEVAAVLGLDPRELLDDRRGFFDLGMDSLTAMELRNRIATGLGVSVPPTLAFDHPTLEALASHLAAELLPGAAGVAGTAAAKGADEQARLVEEIARFSAAELVAQIDDELDKLAELRPE